MLSQKVLDKLNVEDKLEWDRLCQNYWQASDELWFYTCETEDYDLKIAGELLTIKKNQLQILLDYQTLLQRKY
jgi:hypothetical protein